MILVVFLVDRLHGERDASTVWRDRRRTEGRELVPVGEGESALLLRAKGENWSGEGGDSRLRPSHDATPFGLRLELKGEVETR
jgi:hypothetical protein